MMRYALVVLAFLAAMQLAVRERDHRTNHEDAPPAGTSVYAADGVYVGGTAPPIRPHNLIVLLLDTVRRDATAFGDEAPRQMPALRALAARGAAFRQASSMSSWTLPVITSMFTGLLPREHGVLHELPTPTLAPAFVTYAEVLRRTYGYETAAFSDVPFQRGRRTSVLQGFSDGSAGAGHLVRRAKPLESGFWLRDGGKIIDRWSKGRDPKRPFFLFLHAYDAHDAYGAENHPPQTLSNYDRQNLLRETILAQGPLAERSDAALAELTLTSDTGRRMMGVTRDAGLSARVNRYLLDGLSKEPDLSMLDRVRKKYLDGVRWTDESLALFLQALEDRGLMEDTLLVVFGDHGEAFGEHEMIGHGRRLDEELIHVPLVMVGPGPFAAAQVVDASVGLIDVMPTFFDWIGARDLGGSRGQSLLPILRGTEGGHPVIAQVEMDPAVPGWDTRILRDSVRSDRWKYVLEVDATVGTVTEWLFDLRVDPGELHNLAEGQTLGDQQPLPKDFVALVEAVRDSVWVRIEERDPANHVSPIYTGGDATFEMPRPPPPVVDPETPGTE